MNVSVRLEPMNLIALVIHVRKILIVSQTKSVLMGNAAVHLAKALCLIARLKHAKKIEIVHQNKYVKTVNVSVRLELMNLIASVIHVRKILIVSQTKSV